jgi:ABC-2 type transport system permease protein
VVGWTPLAAPYLLVSDVADGAYGAAAGRLGIGAGTVALLLWWWSRSLESAMVGAVSGGTARSRRELAGGPVAQLFPRPLAGLPRTPYGALVAREARYWWRDARRRASLITLGVVGVFIPLMTSFSSGYGRGGPTSPGLVTWTMLFVGSLAAVTLANQFGMDGTAYTANVIAGVPGRVELRARVVAFSLYALPLLVVVATMGAFVTGQPGRLTAMLGGLLAVYGTGLAVNVFVSILGAYALPETSNPFALNSGAGLTKSLLAFVGMVSAIAAAAPVAVAAILVGGVWSWLALPVGLAYGLGAVALGVYLGGDLLDRRAPELLTAISPGRS